MRITLDCFDWSECVLTSELPANSKYLALYLGTFMNKKNDMAWPSQDRIAYETGLTKPTIRKYIQILVENEWLITKQKIHTVNTGRQNYYHNEYHIRFPSSLEQRVKSFPTGPSRGKTGDEQRENSSLAEGKEVSPNNNRITKNNNSRFTPPTLEEIKEYVKEKNYTIDEDRFINFYQSKGWMVGKNKMKDWKAAIRNWSNSTDNVKATVWGEGL